MRPIRLLLLLLMLAVMPVQSWAGAAVCAGGNAGAPHAQAFAAVADDDAGPPHAQAFAAVADDDAGQAAVMLAASAADAAGHDTGDTSDGGKTGDSGDSGDVQDPAQGGADLAESLLPAAPPRFAASLARGSAPAHRAGLLPDPDLPLQPRPPSA